MQKFKIEIPDFGEIKGRRAVMQRFSYEVEASNYEDAKDLAMRLHGQRDKSEDKSPHVDIPLEALLLPRSNTVVGWKNPPDVMRLDSLLVPNTQRHFLYPGALLELRGPEQERMKVQVLANPIDELMSYYFVMRQ